MDALLPVFASIYRCFWADFLLASVLVSVALESSRGQSNTLEFDEPCKGFPTFSCSRNDATAKRTCRKTCEFGLRTRSANRGQFSLDGSAVWRRFWLRFHSEIVPESMKMTSEEPGDSGGRLGSVSGASGERLGSSRTVFGTAGRQKVGSTVDQSRPKSAGKAVQAGRVLHSKSRQKSGLDLTRLPGGGGFN